MKVTDALRLNGAGTIQRAATHLGTCQVCGKEQKLPSGVLSKHGYSVAWGFFSGVCPGAGHQPFELSKDLIDAAITTTIGKIAKLTARATELEKEAVAPEATCYVYRTTQLCRGREKPGHEWVFGKIEARPPRHGMRFAVVAADNREYYIHTGGYRDTDLNAATHNNREYSRSLLARAVQMRNYVTWQQGRINDWKPQELRSIASAG